MQRYLSDDVHNRFVGYIIERLFLQNPQNLATLCSGGIVYRNQNRLPGL